MRQKRSLWWLQNEQCSVQRAQAFWPLNRAFRAIFFKTLQLRWPWLLGNTFFI